METASTTPVRRVVIVGRPNVGKSALFNRLAGQRIAIVHEERGVTRDRLMCEARWGGQRFELVDTGGITTLDRGQASDTIEAGVLQQVQAALAESSVILLVVDIESGLLPLDEEAARMARAANRPVLVAANKADTALRDRDAAEFDSLGFPVFPVSALRQRGLDALLQQVVGRLPPVTATAAVTPLRVAIVGRPNVGKSSYVNRLLRSDRVIVSPVPGTTRDSVSIPFVIGQGPQARHYVLIDTAGLRHAGKVDSVVERFSQFRAEKSIASADVVVLVLDAVQGPTTQDKKIADLVQEHRRGCLMIVNKWDLASGLSPQTYAPAVHRVMPFMAHCPIVFVSAQTGFNIRRSVDAIDHVAAQVQMELPTSLLNRVIGRATKRVQPASVKGRRLKIFYATQTGRAPVVVTVFVNDPELARPEYQTFLVHELRGHFGLEGVPVTLRFVARPQKERPGGSGSGGHSRGRRSARGGRQEKG